MVKAKKENSKSKADIDFEQELRDAANEGFYMSRILVAAKKAKVLSSLWPPHSNKLLNT